MICESRMCRGELYRLYLKCVGVVRLNFKSLLNSLTPPLNPTIIRHNSVLGVALGCAAICNSILTS